MISTAVEENPRETKRFLNNFTIAYEIYHEKGLDPKELLILQTLNMRWNYSYLSIVTSKGKFLEEIEPYLQNRDILNQMNLKTEAESLTSKEKVLLELKDDIKCWTFIKEHLPEIKGIKAWS